MDTASNRAVSSRGAIRAEEHATADAQREAEVSIETVAFMIICLLVGLLESGCIVSHRRTFVNVANTTERNGFSAFFCMLYTKAFLVL